MTTNLPARPANQPRANTSGLAGRSGVLLTC